MRTRSPNSCSCRPGLAEDAIQAVLPSSGKLATMNVPECPVKKSKSVKPVVWSSFHDEMCQEIMVVDPFTGTKKSPVARGKKREEVAENLNQIEAVYFTVDKRAVRDRYNLLAWLKN
ncbi:unnamed protein product [Porites evermanni]|uniref:Uncharacterized protein n=2 Tax=Porites evermanni TaxID=104178 RepID=A0ABN8ML80_9CNID|nr:unnamed protein product [Porites evermanni]